MGAYPSILSGQHMLGILVGRVEHLFQVGLSNDIRRAARSEKVGVHTRVNGSVHLRVGRIEDVFEKVHRLLYFVFSELLANVSGPLYNYARVSAILAINRIYAYSDG